MKNFTTEFKLQAERRADTPEFYGNRIIAGITREAASSSIASLLSVNAARTINMYKSDIASTLEEALMMPKQNIGFIAAYFIPDEILEEISKGLYQAFSRTPPAHYCGGVPGFAAVTFPQQPRGLSRPY